jgi:cell division protein FtsI (penicillin-binding protein 3)
MKKILAVQDYARVTSREATVKLAGAERKNRLILINCFIFAWAVILVTRLVHLQINDHEKWEKWAIRQHLTNVKVASERGPIYDSEGRILAVSVPASSLYIRPKQVPEAKKAEVIDRLVSELQLDPAFVKGLFTKKQPFVWIKRQIPRDVASQVENLQLPGVGSMMEAKRYYPYNQAASTLIGRVGVDGEGLSGMELAFNKHLSAPDFNQSVVKDALGNLIDTAEASIDLEAGEPGLPKGQALSLTIDAEIQNIIDNEVEKAYHETKAKAVMAVMVDPKTGDVLALSQSPSPNFNNPITDKTPPLKNFLTEMVVEPGSIMKPLVTAAALNEGLTRPGEMFDCENGRYQVGKHTVKDVHPSGVISVRDVVVRSSNIGMTKIGMRLGKERLHGYLKRFGFGEASGLKLPGESRGIFRNYQNWALIDIATHSFGQGIAVTPLQMVRALSVIVNDGLKPELRLVKSDEPPVFTRAISAEVAEVSAQMMVDVVEDEHGTGGNAKLKGLDAYEVGGKTGTAQKAKDGGGGYEAGKYVSSFVGFIRPKDKSSDQRQYVLLVSVDEARAKSIYGGVLAAPVFQSVASKVLTMQNRAKKGS